MPPSNCMVCGSGPCKYCSCKKVWYCGEVCQKEHWNLHKTKCPYRGWKSSLLDKPDPAFADSAYCIGFTRRLLRDVLSESRGCGVHNLPERDPPAIFDFDTRLVTHSGASTSTQAPDARSRANRSGPELIKDAGSLQVHRYGQPNGDIGESTFFDASDLRCADPGPSPSRRARGLGKNRRRSTKH